MSVFHGNWNEDPREFLTLYLQHTAASDDDFKARQFINYLGAGSEADDWFDELSLEERKDWVAIECSFGKRWLKEEVLSIKETVTTENEPQPTSTLAPFTSPDSTTALATQTETTASRNLKLDHTTCAPLSQSPAPFENGRKIMKIGITSEICNTLPCNTNFSLPTSSTTVSNLSSPSTMATVLETRSTLADLTPKQQKVEKSTISGQTTLQTLAHSSIGHTNNVPEVYASPPTHNHAVLEPSAFSSTASSSQSYQPSASSGHEKSTPLRAVFVSQPPTGLPAPTTIVSALETRSASTGFTENNQKIEISPIFTQNHLEAIILGYSKCADNIDSPLTPTTIITALEICSALGGFTEKHQKVEKPTTIYIPKGPKPAEPLTPTSSGLHTPSIAPTKHPCNLSEDDNVYFISTHLSDLFLMISLVMISVSFISFLSFFYELLFLGRRGRRHIKGGHMEYALVHTPIASNPMIPIQSYLIQSHLISPYPILSDRDICTC